MSFRSQNRTFIIDHMRENNFFNTTHLIGEELETEQSNAKSTQAKVLKHFEKFPKKGFIWSDITTELNIGVESYGSVKRCLTNLMNEGKLHKSTNVKKSIFGKKAHFYFLIQ